MSDTDRRQAAAYLEQAETTLDSARVLFERDAEQFAPQIVKNAYDALEGALSAGIAATGLEIPRRHPGKLQVFFGEYDADRLERLASHWLSRRDRAQYVDFEGDSLTIPADHFDAADAEEILDDASEVVEYVRELVEE